MGRAPCCSKVGLNRGPWTPREDTLLTKYIEAHGKGHWRSLPQKAGLFRCGKSCRLRWMNYLRPDIKRGDITPDEDELIIRMHSLLGNRWSLIAGRLPGRTDNEIKNYWNTSLSKMLMSEGTDPNTHQKISQPPAPASKDNKRKKQQYHNAKSTSNTEKRLLPKKPKVYFPKPTRVTSFVNLPRNDIFTTSRTTVSEKPKVYFPKPTRVTSFVNLPRNDSFTTSRTTVSSSLDQVLDHGNNIMIPWSDFREVGVVFSSGDGSSLDFEFDDQSRITPNVAAGRNDPHTLEHFYYDEYLQALLGINMHLH